VSGDKQDIKTWVLKWITEHHVMKDNAEEFLECLHFPQIESNNSETHVHFIDEISDEQFHLLMNSDKGAYDSGTFHGILRSTLYALSLGYVFNIEDLFICLLVDTKEYEAEKIFSPWIQKIINRCARQE
jgi:hypothetical protein